jgi:phosphatidylglycerol:prolipoprotein diacylglycerol transferase
VAPPDGPLLPGTLQFPAPDSRTRRPATAAARPLARATPVAPVKPAAPGPGARPASDPGAPGGTAAAPPGSDDEELPAWAAKALEEVLMVTYWIDPGEEGDPFTATVRFTGRRRGMPRKPQPGDTFAQEETVSGIVPGSGPVAITAKVTGIAPGEWNVTAEPVARAGNGTIRPYPPPGADADVERRVPWPRRVTVPAQMPPTARTRRLAATNVPGIVRMAYATLVSLGVLVGLGVEALLLHVGHYSAFGPLMYSLAAVAAGAICGKVWYIVVQGGRKFDGWCIQGFVAGAVIVIGAAAITGTGTPSGVLLSAAAPALLIGMSVGRPGCFFAGCCTGRPTAARWGVWSSDRRLGCRREPAQLLEALSALLIGVAVLCVVLLAGLERSGPVAVAGLAAYTLIRQFIIGMRAEPRRWKYGRRVTAAAAALALVASLILLAVG